MTTRTPGRHRAAVRPKTPLTPLTTLSEAVSQAVAASAGTMGRRSAVLATSSGLVLSIGLPVASATPVVETLPALAVARPAVQPAPQADAPDPDTPVTVPADAQVSFAGSVFTTATPPPPPPPPAPEAEQEERQERAARASRSADREPAPAAPEEEENDSGAPEFSQAGGSIVDIASRYTGIMYRYGGTTPDGFDCSGFTQYVYRQAGISLPRTSAAQAAGGRRISASEARPGDLVYTPGHVGIYVGGNQMIDSPRTGKAVAVREMWFTPTFITYR